MTDTSNPTVEDGTKSTSAIRLDPKGEDRGISVDRPTYDRLLIAYNQACADDKDQFVFDGFDLLTKYAKYLLEYVDERLDIMEAVD